MDKMGWFLWKKAECLMRNCRKDTAGLPGGKSPQGLLETQNRSLPSNSDFEKDK